MIIIHIYLWDSIRPNLEKLEYNSLCSKFFCTSISLEPQKKVDYQINRWHLKKYCQLY